jgi:hypothetical protein
MAFSTFKTNMTLFFQQKNGTASAVGAIPPEDMPLPDMIAIPDPEDPEETIEVLDTDKELRKLARTITDEYHLAIGTAYQQKGGTSRLINPAIYNGPMNTAKEGIFLAILAVLKAMHSDKGPKPSTVLMLPIGAAVIAYWSMALVPSSFLPVPMPLTPPFTTPAPGSILLFPGNPRPIAKGFKDAFSKYDNERDFDEALSKMLDDIIKGFEDHLASVSGIYVGLVPAPPVIIPMVMPWKGVKVQ